MLLALEAVICFTPLGQLRFSPTIVATLGAIPIAITGILLGTAAGAAMGAFGGIFSLCVWTFAPPDPLTAFVFTPFYSLGEIHGNGWSIVISVVPRILVGIVASLVYRVISKSLDNKGKSPNAAYVIAGALASLANTFGVLGGMYLFFGKTYVTAFGMTYKAVLLIIGGLILTNGIPEAIACAIVSVAVCIPIKKIMQKTL